MVAQSNDDFLLKNYVIDIKKQAYLLIFQTKCQIFKSFEIKEMEKLLGKDTPVEKACEEISKHVEEDNFEISIQKDKGLIVY